jgi:chemotaxis protein CheD
MTNLMSWQFKNIENVQTGEVKTGNAGMILIASAIGSCMAVVAIDAEKLVGGIAHIMLPGKAPSGDTESPITRYAENGFHKLLDLVYGKGARKEELTICLAGAANVLMDANDTICRENIDSVLRLCGFFGFAVKARSLGGFLRRKITLDIENCRVLCAIGDRPEFILWNNQEG